MKRRGESYLGGHSIVYAHPVGIEPKPRHQKKKSKSKLRPLNPDDILRDELDKSCGFYGVNWNRFHYLAMIELCNLVVKRCDKSEICEFLNEVKFLDARGERWTDDTVDQLIYRLRTSPKASLVDQKKTTGYKSKRRKKVRSGYVSSSTSGRVLSGLKTS